MQLLRDLLASVDGVKETDLIDGEKLESGEEVLDIELTLDQKKLYTRYVIMIKATNQASKKLNREYLLAVADKLMTDDTEAIVAAKETFDRGIAILNDKLRLIRDALFACIKVANPRFATANIVAIRKGWKVVVNDGVVMVPPGMGGPASLFSFLSGHHH